MAASFTTSCRRLPARSAARSRPFFNADAILANFEKAERFSRKAWGLLSLELWHQIFHDRAAEYPALLPSSAARRVRRARGYSRTGDCIHESLGNRQVRAKSARLSPISCLRAATQFCRSTISATGRRDNLTPHPHLTPIEGTIVDRRLVDRLFDEFKPELVVHTAASYKDPEDWYADALINAVGSANIAKACKNHKVRRLIYFQTALCYGTKPTAAADPLDHPINPVNSSYAISKTAGEHYVQFSGVDWVTFRLANVIGPRNVSGPLPIFYRPAVRGKGCFVTPARRDFCYAGDLAAIVVQAADGAGSGTYHFSSGSDVAIKELYDAVVGAMKLNDYPEPEMRPLGPDDAPSILLDPSTPFAGFRWSKLHGA